MTIFTLANQHNITAVNYLYKLLTRWNFKTRAKYTENICDVSDISGHPSVSTNNQTICRLTADCLQTTCRLTADCLQTICRLSADYLQTICRLTADYLQTVCRLTADYLQTDCRLPAD